MQREATHIFDDIGLGHIAEYAVPQRHIENRCVVVTLRVDRPATLAADNSLDPNIAHHRLERPLGTFLVIEIDEQKRVGNFSNTPPRMALSFSRIA